MKRVICFISLVFISFLAFAQFSEDSPINVQQLLKDKNKYSEKEVYVKGRYEAGASDWYSFNLSYNDYVIEVILTNDDLGAQRRFEKLNIQEGNMIVVKGRFCLPDNYWFRSYPFVTDGVIANIDYSPKPQGEFEIEINMDNREVVDKPGNISYVPEGRSNAHLQGRKVDGQLVAPTYKRQDSGIVVVSIWVDVYGNVQKAVPGAEGTTVNDANLWSEARAAAMRTHFTKVEKIQEDTPVLQEGTITYIFKLK